MTELQDDQKLERLVHIHGIGKVVVTISTDGISFRIPKTKMHVNNGWVQVVSGCCTTTNVPSFLYGKPFELLLHQAEQAEKRAAEKETN